MSLSLSAILTIVDEATRPLKMIQQMSDSSSNSIEDLTRSIDRLNQTFGGSNARKYNQSLQQASQSTSKLQAVTRLLAAEYGHVDRGLTSLLNKTDQWNAQLKQNRQNIFKDVRSTAMQLTAVGFAASVPIKAFADAEEASTKLKVSMMDSTGKVAPEFEKINQLATKLGAQLPGSNADFQNMMTNLVQQGISFKSILGGTGEAAGNLAVLLKMPFDEAANFAAKMQDATQTAEGDMLSLMDTIQRTAYLGVDPTNMLGGFAKLGAGMKTIKQIGLDGANAMAPLLVMADQSGMTDLSSAGNAYSKIFKAMLDQGKINKALKGTKLSFDFSDGKGEFGGLDRMFKQLEKLKGLTTQQRNGIISDIFGNDAENMQVLNLLINKGKAGYEETIAKMERQADLQTRINAQLGTLKNIWEQAQGAMTNVMVDFVAAIAPDLKSFVNRISEIAEKLSAWAKANPELVRTIAKIALHLIMFKVAMLGLRLTTNLFFSAIVGLLAGITKLTIMLWLINKVADRFGIRLPTRLSVIAKGIRLLGQAFIFLARQAIPMVIRGLIAMSASLLANPLTWIIVLIGLVAVAIYRYWGPIKAFFKGFWDGLKIGLAPFIDTLRASFSSLKTTLSPLKPIWDALVNVWNIFKGVIAEALTPFQATNAQLANAASYGQSFGQALGIVLGMLGEVIVTLIRAAGVIFTVFGTAIGEFAGRISMLPEQVSAAFNSVKASVMEAGAAFINYLLTPLRQVIGAVNLLITGMNKIPNVNIPKIPQVPQLNASAPGAVPAKPVQTKAIIPLRAPQSGQTVNHFGAPQISITGVTDPKAVGAVVDQKMKNWQSSFAAPSSNRSYSDQN